MQAEPAIKIMGRQEAWLTLHLLPGLGAMGCRTLIDHFGGPVQVLAADRQALARVENIRREAVAALSGPSRQEAAKAAVRELVLIRQQGISLLAWDDPLYPDQLRTIHSPPMLLYVKGDTEVLGKRGLAMIGSRACTDYGRNVANRMARDLARQGFVIISGLALGIDAEAHRGALAAGGATVAVLGCGLDLVYPRANQELFQKIPAHGAIVSEYPLGTKPDSFRFPARNRIISGLAQGVVVVEAAKNSGSLITAQHALEQGREVFAVPGRVDSFKSAGTHALLQQGAKLVQSVNDIIEELPTGAAAEAGREPPTFDLSLAERQLCACLDVYPKTIDEIAVAATLPAQKASELLLLLELKGAVRSLPGNCFQLTTSLA